MVEEILVEFPRIIKYVYKILFKLTCAFQDIFLYFFLSGAS